MVAAKDLCEMDTSTTVVVYCTSYLEKLANHYQQLTEPTLTIQQRYTDLLEKRIAQLESLIAADSVRAPLQNLVKLGEEAASSWKDGAIQVRYLAMRC